MNLQYALKRIQKADHDFNMIQDGDKIAVGLSGGKDSMLLFLCLSIYQKFNDKNFELVGIHIDVGFEDFEHDTMKDFARQYNLNLYIEKTRIFEILKRNENKDKIQCSLCSNLKKGALCKVAMDLGCNKLALGHHSDDAIETLFLNMIHGAKIATFSPCQYMSKSNMTMIRPLIYCEEKEIIKVCTKNQIPSVKRVCPNDGNTQRQEIKDLLNEFYTRYPIAQKNFLTSLSNLEQVDLWKKQR
ncbi:MAG: tRNA 2-thiocytidine(32) synthetase TtcA [Holdemanella sp.]|nr:tRNA 2-thiocytidine(32) synthetase TtcA [Holdemanella sp.]